MQATNPLATRSARTRFNKAMRAKGVPAKVCSRCLAVKALSAFPMDRSAPDGRASYCTACRRATNAEHSAVNADIRREYGREYRAANRSRPLDIGDGHLPKRCAPNTSGGCGRLLIRGDFHRNRNSPDQRDALCRNCRARKEADRKLIKRLRLVEYWDEIGAYTCHLCQRDFAEDDEIHIEHIMPKALGGSDDRENLLPAHAECNMRKRDADPLEYLPAVLAERGIDFFKAIGGCAE
ncbi:HNH endonuclease [Streptomyces albogriseolus]|uniref:HNH endonuclease n=1 Tax=Streptomyces albogriseolus TaxID=1887 RepID=UPI003CEEEF8C